MLDGGGGFPARPEEEAWGLLIQVNLIYLPFLYFQQFLGVLLPHFSFYIFPFFVFTGTKVTEMCQLTMQRGMAAGWGSPTFRNSRAGEVRDASGRFREMEGFYGLLRGAMLHSSISSAQPPHKKVCYSPSATHPLRRPRNPKLLVLPNMHQNQPL